MPRRFRWPARIAFPIIVFDIHKPGAFAATMRGEGTFTIIRDEG
jgi:hypothetical protein